MCVNNLIHREFSNPYPAKLIIEKENLRTENANRAKMIGKINVDFYEPYPKNPKIAKIFKEIGLADELGSGVRNMVKYTKIYSGGIPEFKEDDIFKTNVPLILDVDNVGLNEIQNKILKLISNNKNVTQKEISEELNTTKRTIERNIMILKEMNLIERIGSRKSGYWKINIDKLGK